MDGGIIRSWVSVLFVLRQSLFGECISSVSQILLDDTKLSLIDTMVTIGILSRIRTQTFSLVYVVPRILSRFHSNVPLRTPHRLLGRFLFPGESRRAAYLANRSGWS
jgi:hypothetical protein